MCSGKDETTKAAETANSADDEKAKDTAKTVDRLIGFWTHQNTLLWSRLQTLAALQVPVLAGWYFFWTNHRLGFAISVAILGASLTALIWELINCDADRRNDMREKLRQIDPREGEIIFPDTKRWIRGLTVMRMIVLIFLVIDIALAFFAGAKLACA